MRVVDVRLAGHKGYVEEQTRQLDLGDVTCVWPYDGDEGNRKMMAKLTGGDEWILGFDSKTDATAFREQWKSVKESLTPKPNGEVKRGPGRPPGSKNKE